MEVYVRAKNGDFIDTSAHGELEREIFIDNLLVQVHLILEMIVEERPCAMGV